VLLPAAGGSELYWPGQAVMLQWNTTGFAPSDTCRLQLLAWAADDRSCTNHSAGCAGSMSPRLTLEEGVANSGEYTWTVPGPFHVFHDWADSPLLRIGCDCVPGIECAHAYRAFGVNAQAVRIVSPLADGTSSYSAGTQVTNPSPKPSPNSSPNPGPTLP